MTDKYKDIVSKIDEQIEKLVPNIVVSSVGTVVKVIDGVAFVSGMSDVMYGELVKISGTFGLALNLATDTVGIVVLGDYTGIKEGDKAESTGEILSISASEAYFGRVINPLGTSIDGKGKIVHPKNVKKMPVEKIAPGIVYRQPVNVPLQTGIKAIDAMIPIGRGQRELIIGDRNTGKTSIAVDTIINQANQNRVKSNKRVICVYVAIGQKQSKVVNTVEVLDKNNAMNETIVISATSSDPIAMQYLAPYAGTAIAEYFMGLGEDVLVVYDDLTKHAWSYRQISLTFKRPSGREAYPGDIFYLHSRLLERSCRLSVEEGGGSITSLPIIETQAQDISAYIPTNVISITDGQIFLEPDLFYKGVRPAVSVGLSVSRVGGAAQIKAMKQVAGKLRLNLAQFEELSAFAQFGADMDESSKKAIDRGRRIIEIFKQPQFSPRDLAGQIFELWYVENGYLDSVELSECLSQASSFSNYVKEKYSDLTKTILEKGMSDESTEKLKKIADKFTI